MPKATRPPQLIAEHGAIRCSVCGMPFEAQDPTFRDISFAEHVRKSHKRGQTSEDISQAAFRVVREATDDK